MAATGRAWLLRFRDDCLDRKGGHVGTDRQIDPQFACVLRLEVVLCQPLADFNGRIADDRILRRVVRRFAAKHRCADAPLLQGVLVPSRRLHHKPQQGLAALAVPKVRTLQDLRQLGLYGRVVVTQGASDVPGIGIRSSHGP